MPLLGYPCSFVSISICIFHLSLSMGNSIQKVAIVTGTTCPCVDTLTRGLVIYIVALKDVSINGYVASLSMQVSILKPTFSYAAIQRDNDPSPFLQICFLVPLPVINFAILLFLRSLNLYVSLVLTLSIVEVPKSQSSFIRSR